MKTDKIEVGDLVKVVDIGKSYRSDSWFHRKLQLKERYSGYMKDENKGKVCKVIFQLEDEEMLGIENEKGEQFAISIKGVEKVGETVNSNLSEQFISYKLALDIKNTLYNMKVNKTRTVEIKGKQRDLTVAVILQDNIVYAGYSVRMPEDKKIEGLSEKIAEGRALKAKTNLVDMQMGKGMDKKYILYAIANQLITEIVEGKTEIKGVK